MKNVISSLLIISTIVALAGCGSSGGLSVGTKKTDLLVKQLNTLKDFKPKRTLYARSDNEDFEGQVDSLKSDKKLQNYALDEGKDKLPVDIFQKDKNGNEVPLMRIEKDLTFSLPEDGPIVKKGLKPLGSFGIPGLVNSFALCAAIDAQRVRDPDVDGIVDYLPYRISIHLFDENAAQGLRMIHVERSGDMNPYMIERDFVNLGNGVYAIDINLRDGDRFNFYNQKEQRADLASNCLRLGAGVKNQSDFLQIVNGKSPLRSNANAVTGARPPVAAKKSGPKLNRVRLRYEDGRFMVPVAEIKKCPELYNRLRNTVDEDGRSVIGLMSNGQVNNMAMLSKKDLEDCPDLKNRYGSSAKVITKSNSPKESRPKENSSNSNSSSPRDESDSVVVESQSSSILDGINRGIRWFLDAMKSYND